MQQFQVGEIWPWWLCHRVRTWRPFRSSHVILWSRVIKGGRPTECPYKICLTRVDCFFLPGTHSPIMNSESVLVFRERQGLLKLWWDPLLLSTVKEILREETFDQLNSSTQDSPIQPWYDRWWFPFVTTSMHLIVSHHMEFSPITASGQLQACHALRYPWKG